MDAATALAGIRGYAGANRIVIIRHAWERMAQRGARYEDVRHALVGARPVQGGRPGQVEGLGEDLDGDELVCVVAIESGVVVVTVY